MWPNPQETADLVTFNEEILSGKLHFLFSEKKNTLLDKKLHEGCVCVVYHNATYSFEELLKKNISASLHYRNIQVLVTEKFRVCKKISPKIMTEVFQLNRPLNYNVRHLSDFSARSAKSVYYCRKLLG